MIKEKSKESFSTMSTHLTSPKSPSDTPSDMSSNSTESCVDSTGKGFTGRGRSKVIPGNFGRLEIGRSLGKEPLPVNSDQVRDKWTHSHEFVFAVAGCAIGLGNVWRFPYLCYKYGGGSFLIPYLFFLFAVGVPLMMMEITMGQFMSLGGIEAWNMARLPLSPDNVSGTSRSLDIPGLRSTFYLNKRQPK